MLEARKSPQQQRARRTFEAVVEAAAQVLEAGGLAAFNTNAVAARAGVSIGSLYQYFPGKDALMAALIRREAAAFAARMDAVLAATADRALAEAVAGMAAAAVEHQTARPRLARLLDLEEARLQVADEAERASSSIQARLAVRLATGGIGDPDRAARDLIGLARGMIDVNLADDTTGLAERVTRAACGYLGL